MHDGYPTKILRTNALVVIPHEGRVLLEKGHDDIRNLDFYRPLGGGIEFMEKSQDTAIREIKEEIGATLVQLELLTVFENIFEFNAKPGHEITFLYKGELAETEFYQRQEIPILDKSDSSAEWISVSEIQEGKVLVFPGVVRDFL